MLLLLAVLFVELREKRNRLKLIAAAAYSSSSARAKAKAQRGAENSLGGRTGRLNSRAALVLWGSWKLAAREEEAGRRTEYDQCERAGGGK